MDLVVLSEVRWGYFRTRKQFLLSRFPERWRVFFAQPPAAGDDDPWWPRARGTRHLLHRAVPEARHEERALQPVLEWRRAAR